MCEKQSVRYPVKLFQKHLSKGAFGMKNSGPFYLRQLIVNRLTNIWFKKCLWEKKVWYQTRLFRIVSQEKHLLKTKTTVIPKI